MPQHIQLQTITCKEEFEHYRETWSEILAKKNNTNPFIEFDWVKEWWNAFGENQSIEIIVVKRNNLPIAFFPFLYEKKMFCDVYQFLSYGQSNYMDVIVSATDLKECVEWVLDELIQKRRHIVFYLHGLLESTQTVQVFKAYIRRKQLAYSEHQVITPYIRYSDIEHEKHKIKRRRLNRLDRREKRLYTNAPIRFAECPPDEIDYIFHLHRKRWKKKRDTSGFTTSRAQTFYKKLTLIENDDLKVEVDGLYLDDQMIAFNYGFHCRGKYLGYVLGYDDDFAVFSPGRLLEKKKIIQCENRADEVFDLSIGYETYKFDWNTDVDYTNKIIFSSKSRLATALRLLISGKELMIERLKKNYRLVLFIRNQVGKFLYTMNRLSKKDFKELKKIGSRALKFMKTKLYHEQRFIVYKIEGSCLHHTDRESELIELTLADAIHDEEIMKHHIKAVCGKIYNGYKGYYLKGELVYDHVLWMNERGVRVEELAYFEAFNTSSIYLRNWKHHHLKEVFTFMRKNYKANSLYVSLDEKEMQDKQMLEGLGFQPVKYISQKIIVGFTKQTVSG